MNLTQNRHQNTGAGGAPYSSRAFFSNLLFNLKQTNMCMYHLQCFGTATVTPYLNAQATDAKLYRDGSEHFQDHYAQAGSASANRS